ncbi:MAG: DUF4132 domain-containing protein, partial [Anaerolineales bacterium]|nr:DUF4132 domain-containing protein [Anaerolineales bacterium]
LLRFNSVLQAVNNWLDLKFDLHNLRELETALTALARFLAEPALARRALHDDDPRLAHHALIALAQQDVMPAIQLATALLAAGSADHQLVAAVFLSRTDSDAGLQALRPLLRAEDRHLLAVALDGLQHSPRTAGVQLADVVTQLPRLPARAQELPARVWPWWNMTLEPQLAGKIILGLQAAEPATAIIPYFDFLNADQKQSAIRRLKQAKVVADEAVRGHILNWIGERAQGVWRAACEAAATLTLREAESQQLEGYLTRKTARLRRELLGLLLGQADEMVLASTGRLLAAGRIAQREAGLELLAQMVTDNRATGACCELAREYQTGARQLNQREESLLQQVLATDAVPPGELTLEDGLGLFDNSQRSQPLTPRPVPFATVTETVRELVRLVDEWVAANQDQELEVHGWRGPEVLLLDRIAQVSRLTAYDSQRSLQENLDDSPAAALWLPWWQTQLANLPADISLDLLRTIALSLAADSKNGPPHLGQPRPQPLAEQIPLKNPLWVGYLLGWSLHLIPWTDEMVDFVLDGVEHTFYQLSQATDQSDYWLSPYFRGQVDNWVTLFTQLHAGQPELVTAAQHARYWRLLRWRDEPAWGASAAAAEKLKQQFLGEAAANYVRLPRSRPGLRDWFLAFQAKAANEHDLLDMLIGQWNDAYFRPTEQRYYYSEQMKPEIVWLFRRARQQRRPELAELANHPLGQQTVAAARERILAVELQRGDLPTVATPRARALPYSGGAQSLIRLLRAFGRRNFVRGYVYDGVSFEVVFSHLIQVSYPSPDETPEVVAPSLRDAGIGKTRLLETAAYAPHWAAHIEAALGWPGLAEAVWWFHAHTREPGWRVEQDIRAAWAAEISDHTPLTADDLLDGAVDVAWFRRAHERLGAARWQELATAARYTTTGNGHKRAQLFSAAMLGELDPGELRQRIQQKRFQDGVRALGLLPLSEGKKARQAEILDRYLLLQEFGAGSRRFGSQRQNSERLALRIGMENLARTAGYADPIRLEWAMEQEAVADLAAGPVTVTAEGVTISLVINALGEAELGVVRQLADGRQKSLKRVPARLKKLAEVKALTGRKTAIRQQASRTRRSLEEAMMRGDAFSGGELQALSQHPVLRPMLADLLFVRDEDGALGYPVDDGRGLQGLAGAPVRVTADDELRLAHPHDLLTRDWHQWQHDCFQAGRIQPFRQIFRELYVPTPVEISDAQGTRRYAGQEINPRRAHGLLSQRGWLVHPYEGIRKSFHTEQITVHIEMMYGAGTAAAVGGETVDAINFIRWEPWQSLPVTEVPPRLFSEVMRDVDLLVSVAHLGRVDPESSQSSVEFRAQLVRETAALLKLANVTVQTHHVLISGQRNDYSVHLGSGVVHQRPGGYVCMVPVHNAQRGRIFLPFVDRDPKSAEIIAKVVLLANDRKIKDPVILAQLLNRPVQLG